MFSVKRTRTPQSKAIYGDRLTVSGRKMLLLADNIVDVHELTGDFVGSFGQGVLNSTSYITATCDSRIMIVDPGDSCVHLFTVEGQQLVKFNYTKIKGDFYYRISCHSTGQHIVLAAKERKTDRLALAMYTVDGEFEQRILLEWIRFINGISVTLEGYIAVACNDMPENEGIVIVV